MASLLQGRRLQSLQTESGYFGVSMVYQYFEQGDHNFLDRVNRWKQLLHCKCGSWCKWLISHFSHAVVCNNIRSSSLASVRKRWGWIIEFPWQHHPLTTCLMCLCFHGLHISVIYIGTVYCMYSLSKLAPVWSENTCKLELSFGPFLSYRPV